MKPIFVILFAMVTVLVACQEDTKPVEPVVEVPPKLLKPIIDISYKILDSGYVQFTSKTKNIKNEYLVMDYFRLSEKFGTKLFRFTKNGVYECYYSAYNSINSLESIDTLITFNIEIRNAVRLDTDRVIHGRVFDDSVSFVSENNDRIQNWFYSTWPFGFAPFPPCVWIEDKNVPLKIVIADYNKEPGMDLNSMRKVFTKGEKNLIEDKGQHGWAVWLGYKDYMKTNRSDNFLYTPDRSRLKTKKQSLEIIDVKEVYQPYLFQVYIT